MFCSALLVSAVKGEDFEEFKIPIYFESSNDSCKYTLYIIIFLDVILNQLIGDGSHHYLSHL